MDLHQENYDQATKSTQNGTQFISGLNNDAFYVFVSAFNPATDTANGQYGTVVGTYEYDQSKQVIEQIIGIKRIYPPNVRLVQPRNYDFINGVAQVMPTDPVPASVRFVTSQNPESANSEFYMYECMIGSSTPTAYPKALAEKIVEGNYTETCPYRSTGGLPAKTAWKLLYKIQGEDAKFVTPYFVPVVDNVDTAGVQAKIHNYANDGEVFAVRVTNGGTGYITGERVTVTLGNGAGFHGAVREVGGVIQFIEIINKGIGYRQDASRVDGTYNQMTVATSGGSGAVLDIVYAPPGGFGYNQIWEILPQYLMYLSEFEPSTVNPESPFVPGMAGYTFGILREPVQFRGKDKFKEEYGNANSTLTFTKAGGFVSSPPAFPPSGKVRIRIGANATNFQTTFNTAEGWVALFTYDPLAASGQGQITLKFANTDTSAFQLIEGATYDIQVEEQLTPGSLVTTVNVPASQSLTNLTLTKYTPQDIELRESQLFYARQSGVYPAVTPWIVSENTIRNFRLVFPLI